MNTKGHLEVICGSMFSGKSEELIRRLRRAEFAQLTVEVFKPIIDNRKTVDHIHAHSGDRLAAQPLHHAEQLLATLHPETQVIGIDEVQFFNPEIVPIIFQLIDQGRRVIVAGLDLDFRGQPFGCVPTLLAYADSVTKLTAICMCCGKDAHFTQRLVNGRPARFNDPLIVIGAQECYQARCRNCYRIET